MPAASDVRDDLLGLLGLESIDHAPAGTQTRMLADLNGALQQIFSTAPDSFWSEEPQAELIRAPFATTLTVTANSKAITFAGYASWMQGCTIVIDGDATQNALVMSAGASVSLLKPYTGSSGAGVGAVVYNDLIHPGAGVEQVMAPVIIEGKWELVPVAHERNRQTVDASAGGNHGSSPLLYPLTWSDRPIQIPRAYLIERSAVYLGASTPAIRLSTLPDQALRITYRVKLTAPAVTSFSDTRTWLVPHSYHASILLPIVRWRFASWPQFTGDKTSLKDDYNDALAHLASLRPRGMSENHVQLGEDW